MAAFLAASRSCFAKSCALPRGFLSSIASEAVASGVIIASTARVSTAVGRQAFDSRLIADVGYWQRKTDPEYVRGSPWECRHKVCASSWRPIRQQPGPICLLGGSSLPGRLRIARWRGRLSRFETVRCAGLWGAGRPEERPFLKFSEGNTSYFCTFTPT